MAERSEIDRILAQYGTDFESPATANFTADPQNELGTQATTADAAGLIDRMYSGLPGALRSGADRIRGASRPDNILAGGLDTAANWVSGTPRIGEDTLAPLGLGALAMPFAVPGAVGIFGGRLARTADQDALRRAEEMAGAGRPREEIWDQTGWFRGPDGQWRFEIDDSAARFRPDEPVTTHSESVVSDAISHPGLFAAYPELGRAPFSHHVPAGTAGQFMPDTGEIAVTRSPVVDVSGGRTGVALHELQHAIQGAEEFARGANIGDFTYGNSPMFQHRRSYETPGQAYRRVAGEVEARNVQTRAGMSPEERRASPPWQTQDVPDVDQILRQYYGPGAQMSMQPSVMSPQEFSEYLAKKYGADVDLVQQRNDLRLQHIAVPRDQRGRGVGSSIMDEIASYADANGRRVILTPATRDDSFGTTSRSRLVNFYRRHGYLRNQGRDKDFTISDGMYREPKPGETR